MCGIALIISGICFDSSSLNNVNGKCFQDSNFSSYQQDTEVCGSFWTIDDLKEALQRRGPDHLGSEIVLLKQNEILSSGTEENFFSDTGANSTNGHYGVIDSPVASHSLSADLKAQGPILELEKADNDCREEIKDNAWLLETEKDCDIPRCEVKNTGGDGLSGINSSSEMHFFGATLQLRGIAPIHQPLKDADQNLLIYNGEVFGGIHVDRDENDGEVLMHALRSCCSCKCHGDRKVCLCSEKMGHIRVPQLLSTIKGPWALIYWQESSKTLWFGKDAFGRRSLLVHWPNSYDPRLVLSSIALPLALEGKCSRDTGWATPRDNFGAHSDIDEHINDDNYWEELPCGIYSITFGTRKSYHNNTQNTLGRVSKHEWTDPQLQRLVKWDRAFVDPKLKVTAGVCQLSLAEKVLVALKLSIIKRTTQSMVSQKPVGEGQKQQLVPVAVLFSGGLDSMILAALLDQCLSSCYDIDLINVSFDCQSAPDRISSKEGMRELQRIAPSRRWRLVEIDADLSNLARETKHVISLINPAKTYMDLNIGIALWLAAGGEGWVDEETCNNYERVKYKSEAKILFVGSGADEQCAGYGRHRTKYRQGGTGKEWCGHTVRKSIRCAQLNRTSTGLRVRCLVVQHSSPLPLEAENYERTTFFPLLSTSKSERNDHHD
ncbi:asparagine synthetase domain-containing protein 1 isoform X1 [Amborella trichopoda]|uniref:asparagine synthetase domain-containing protein 1 isoform X1 n=2 Tax=Amborella trichopoda TaxID=13333 RepID=UPI0009BF6B26|nr:asparagine synthetase domain-containing protein 1 isoform X1 [Amborella trichopoda]|eukprot:XP_020523832.1 asparagine synthetase domain-containing protein 1 isoform X1 [Amborella trichopoda]